MPSAMIRRTIYLPPELDAQLVAKAGQGNITQAIIQAVGEWLKGQ